MNRKTKMFRKRLMIGFACGILLCILVLSSNNDLIQRVAPFLGTMPDDDVSCYAEPNTIGSIHTFSADEITDERINERSIFFHETSCFGDEGIVLTSRQACAVESAARMNPSMSVYLLVLSHSNLSIPTRETIRLLSSYKNIVIKRILIDDYVKNTPLEEWWASGVLRTSQWPRSHVSDILRYLTLWKFGGIYLDLDVVITTSLERLTNFAGAEDWEDVAAGVIGLGTTGLGRRMADACIRDLKKNFRGDRWGNNGPGVITRSLQKICATKYARDMTTARCHGFTVYPPSAFYPIYFKKWKLYFDAKEKNQTMEKIEKALAIHVWNKLSRSEPVQVGSEVPYAIVASKYCPKVYNSCGKVF